MLIKKLYLELTDRCNLDCKICYRKSWGQDVCDIKEDVLNKLIDELKMHLELKEIVVGGIGEATCSPHFKKALELLKDYKLTVTTNGTLMNKELSAYFIKFVDVVTISIDGLFDKYKEIRGTDLDVVVRNIKGLNELKTIRRCNFIEDCAVFICATGEVSPCYRFSHNYIEYVFGREKNIDKFVFGNIKEDTLNNIWNNAEYINFREKILHNLYPSCIDCDLVDGCDYPKNAEADCYALSPSCGDCLWSRGFVKCP